MDGAETFILAQARAGNRDAFRALVERHSRAVFRVAYRVTGNEQDAEDVVQDAFLKLWEEPAKWHGELSNKFTTWFYRVVVNLCLDQKKRKGAVALDEDMPVIDGRAPVDETMMRAQEQRIMEKEIAALDERQQLVIILFRPGCRHRIVISYPGNCSSLASIQLSVLRENAPAMDHRLPVIRARGQKSSLHSNGPRRPRKVTAV